MSDVGIMGPPPVLPDMQVETDGTDISQKADGDVIKQLIDIIDDLNRK